MTPPSSTAIQLERSEVSETVRAPEDARATTPAAGIQVAPDGDRTADAQQAPAAIALDDVCLTLDSRAGAVEILKSVSLTVPEGQSLSIVGPSGSGKTSLLMVSAGLEPATSGRIAIGGTDITQLDEDARAALRARSVGIVFQSFHLVPTMSAVENVAIPLQFAGRADAFEVARDRLAEVGLGHRIDHFPTQLSGGEQQRVAIARALANEPTLIFADEPTGNLDEASGEIVVELLFRLQREHGVTLVLITHDLELAAMCDRKVSIRDGRIIDDATSV